MKYSLAISCFLPLFYFAQSNYLLDEVVAKVSNYSVMYSDIQTKKAELVHEEVQFKDEHEKHCFLLEELLNQKILLKQADIDSIYVDETQVNMQMNHRMQFFIQKFGSEETLEKQYGKTIEEMKIDLKESLQDAMRIEQVKRKVFENIQVTPSDILHYTKNEQDDLPIVPKKYKIANIIVTPHIEPREAEDIREKLNTWREQVFSGKKTMQAIAALYSEDPSTRTNGGETGFISKGTFVPKFEEVAYSLKKGEISKVFKTKYGYHFMQLISRQGDKVNVRHVLLSPKPSLESLQKAKYTVDSIYGLLQRGELSWENAVLRYSDQRKTKYNQGLLINPYTLGNFFEEQQIKEIEPQLYYSLRHLKNSQYTKPFLSVLPGTNQQVYRLVKIIDIVPEHKVNVETDYKYLYDYVVQIKQQEYLSEWISEKVKDIYVHIDERYGHGCTFTVRKE